MHVYSICTETYIHVHVHNVLCIIIYMNMYIPLEQFALLLNDVSFHSPWLEYQSIENLYQSPHSTKVQVTAFIYKNLYIYMECIHVLYMYMH